MRRAERQLPPPAAAHFFLPAHLADPPFLKLTTYTSQLNELQLFGLRLTPPLVRLHAVSHLFSDLQSSFNTLLRAFTSYLSLNCGLIARRRPTRRIQHQHRGTHLPYATCK
jgi:hypothetical protein